MTADPVSIGQYDWKKPCIEVQRLRDPLANLYDRWCYVHHHWLNDAKPQKTVIDQMFEELGLCPPR